jgi:hypothetical protein
MGWSSFRKTGLTYRDSRSAGGYTLVTPIGGDWVLLIWEWINPFELPFKGVLSSMLFRVHRYRSDGPELAGRLLSP